jgi:hypothetical protein
VRALVGGVLGGRLGGGGGELIIGRFRKGRGAEGGGKLAGEVKGVGVFLPFFGVVRDVGFWEGEGVSVWDLVANDSDVVLRRSGFEWW